VSDRHLVLEARGISKRFHGTQALTSVDFDLRSGEVHTLVGENGAGKSTLIKILGGVHRRDSGDVRIDGVAREFDTPRQALEAGIVVIPQEMQLVPAATVAENVTLGDWPTCRRFGVLPAVHRREMRQRAAAALARLQFCGRLDVPVRHLDFAERQLVAIARALCHRARVLILDEPTASLEHREVERLFATIASLKSDGVGIIFVSHRLHEVAQISDRCTVLRDGRVIDVSERHDIDQSRLVRLMTGRDLAELHRPHRLDFGAPLLEYAVEPDTAVGDRSLAVRQGETVGLAGLLGAGTTDYLRTFFGAGGAPVRLRLDGAPALVAHPSDAIAKGIGLVPGERRQALVMELSIRDNIILPQLRHGVRYRDRARLKRLVAEVMETLDIRPRDPKRPVRELSGGNQQKVAFARWLVGRLGVLLLDEPTHGIDIGAKARLHRLMRDFADRGGGILFSSSEIDEVVSMSDRVLAMRRGAVVARMSREQGAYSERVLREALGG